MATHQPLAPLSVGNVVSAAVTLYRSHLKDYLGIALRATLWQALPILAFVFIGIVAGIGTVVSNNGDNNGVYLLVGIAVLLGFIGAIILWFISLSRSLVNAALISRLAFKELINQPERIKPAREAILPYKWSFLSIGIRVGFAILGIYLGLFIGLIILVFVIAFVVEAVTNNEILTGIITALIGIAAFLGGGFILIWFISRWFIAEVPLAVESNINGVISMDRSWKLTKDSVFRIQGIAVVAFLITLPLLALTSYIPQIPLYFIEQNTPLYWVIYAISLLLGLSGNLLVLPFWQTVKAVLYYDLRNRREGLDFTFFDKSRE